MTGGTVCVVHLVWAPLGTAPLEGFLASYRRFSAGRAHRLAIVYNGFGGEEAREPFRRLLRGIDHDAVETPAPVQDIPAYFQAARELNAEFFCFLNSYSQPLADGWLARLHDAARAPGVGLAGATGSWESRYTNLDRGCAPGHRFLLHVGGSWVRRRERAGIRRYLAQRRELRRARAAFAPFPNPHLRSNAFLLRREVMLRLRAGPIGDKLGALAFESGRDGMTRQVQAMGLQVHVVGADGRGYPPEAWARSRTFRTGAQENLLVSDNRTREYLALSAEDRAVVGRMAWGAEYSAAETG
jgi:hypothetical protein